MRKKQLLLTILIIANILFIWGNSVLSQELSRNLSAFFRDILRNIFNSVGSSNMITNHMVRKSAHVFEYSALSMLLMVFFDEVRLKSGLMSLAAGVSVAIIDETIQIFASRGSAVKDVLIDTGGCLTGFLIIMIIKRIRNQKREME